MVRLVSMLCVLLLAGGVGQVFGQAPAATPTWQIIPGRGIGPLYLGMTKGQALPYLGGAQFDPVKSFDGTEFQWAGMNDGLLAFHFTKDKDASAFTLDVVAVVDGKYFTVQGIHVGSPISAVLSAYGDSGSTVMTREQEQGRIIEPDDVHTLVQCLEVSAWVSRDHPAFNFTFNYPKTGILFRTREAAVGTVAIDMRVYEMRVLAPGKCRPLP